MRTRNHQLIPVVVLFGLGLLLGRITLGHGHTEEDEPGVQQSMRRANAGQLGPRSLMSNDPLVKEASSFAPTSYPDDPVERMLVVMSLDEDVRNQEWDGFVEGLDASEFQAVTDEFSRRRYSTENWMLFMKLWSQWAKEDPDVFLQKSLSYEFYDDDANIADDEFLFEMDRHSIFHSQSAAIRSLAESDPQKAVNWALRNHAVQYVGQEENHLLATAIDIIAGVSPERAFEFVRNFPESADRATSLEYLSRHYAVRGAEAACNWAFGIEDEKLRSMAIADITSHMAKTQPKEIAEWLIANRSESAAGALSRVVDRMSTQDFEAAVEYYQGIQDQGMKSGALSGLINETASAKNPEVIIDLMDANPSLVTDDSVLSFVSGAYSKDPSLAVSNIGRIRDLALRQEAYRVYMLSWMRDDYDKATNWVNTHGVPEAMRLGIEEMIREGAGAQPR